MYFHLLLVILMMTMSALAWADKKVALVIGNSHYVQVNDQLKNPLNDSEDISKKLTALGYSVIKVQDATGKQLLDALDEFQKNLEPNATAIFYYAGHGIQVDGVNYIVPIDAALHSRTRIQNEAISLKQVIESIQSRAVKSSLLIIDACRNDPFPKTYRSAARGLTRSQDITATEATSIWYAASPGQVAQDGNGRNGVFTGELLALMDKPLTLPQIYSTLKRNVREKTRLMGTEEQLIYQEGDILADFSFIQAPAIHVPATVSSAQQAAAATEQQLDIEYWGKIKNTTLSMNFQNYLSRFPQGLFAENAQTKLDQLQGKTRLNELSVSNVPYLGANTLNNQKTSLSQAQLLAKGMWHDPETGLVWMRCVVGQQWNGTTCTHQAVKMTKEEALASANTLMFNNYTWRMPTLAELHTLDRCNEKSPRLSKMYNPRVCDYDAMPPALDTRIFPNPPRAKYWGSDKRNDGDEHVIRLVRMDMGGL